MEESQAQMKLNPVKKIFFWAAVILAAASMLVYAGHLVAQFITHVNVLHLQLIAFLLVSSAFLVLFLGMTVPGRLFARQAKPLKGQDQSPVPEPEKLTDSPLVEPEEPTASPSVEPEEPVVSPSVVTGEPAVSSLVEKETPVPAPVVEPGKPKQRSFDGRIKYYLVIAILCVLYIGLGFSPWAPYQTAFALFVGLPAGFWLIYELSQEEKPGD
jgi:hypothetical protein